MPRTTVERIAPGLLDATLSRFRLDAGITHSRAGEMVSEDALLCCEGFSAGHLDSPVALAMADCTTESHPAQTRGCESANDVIFPSQIRSASSRSGAAALR